jgi:hypothetical protein
MFNNVNIIEPELGEEVVVLFHNKETQATYEEDVLGRRFFVVNGKPEPKIIKWRYQNE